jgi:hypothetical protein
MAHPDVPSLEEITTLTRSELTSQQDDDDIQQCGQPALSLLPRAPDLCLQFAYQKLHDVPYRDVKRCWRRLYTDAALWKVWGILEGRNNGKDEMRRAGEEEDWVTQVVQVLDMALILTGAPAREELIELVFAALKSTVEDEDIQQGCWSAERSAKRRKVDNTIRSRYRDPSNSDCFPTTIIEAPELRLPIPRTRNLSLEAFQSRLSKPETQRPMIIEEALDYWPALSERPWTKPSYLLSQTLNGRRLVPVEIGRSYTDQGWGQKIQSFGQFMREYMLDEPLCDRTTINGNSEEDGDMKSNEKRQTGYLAQHDLFAQIPSLRSDISIPDYCYCEPVPQLSNISHVKSVPKLEDPLLNAWFGPAGTISPLHTDPYHNILAQVVGYKYIRLYAPDQTEKLYPRGTDENGIDMSNTSCVDLDEAMSMLPGISPWSHRDTPLSEDQARAEFEEHFPAFKEAKYIEGVLGPGECLYLPVGWWHYVRSLTPSFSVSFWFN